MDKHFSSANIAHNLPMLMSLLEIWYCNFFAAGNQVVLPYDQGLAQLPDFLQQLTMESNGKRVTRDGEPLDYDSAPVLWGSAGTMGQHSFHQLLHQGTRLCPADFILPLTTPLVDDGRHRMPVTPQGLGALLALYEHRTFCSGQLWGINSFDQWGVELGKEIGSAILKRLEQADSPQNMDAATERLLGEWRAAQKRRAPPRED